MAALYTSALFFTAFLLFLAQPMVAKMLLPLAGGSPMVWTTCMAFFQIALLIGYAVAHGAMKWLGGRRQIAALVVVAFLPFAVLPFFVGHDLQPPAGVPTVWLPLFLAGFIGLPLTVLAASASVLQIGFSRPADRYASYLGIFVALIAYPAFVEPALSLQSQSRLWTAGYAVCVMLIAGCAYVVWRDGHNRNGGTNGTDARLNDSRQQVSNGLRVRWVTMAFIPSSLMLALSTFLSAHIAAVPLLWTLPLALYVLTLIAAFGSQARVLGAISGRMFPILLLPLALLLCFPVTAPIELMLPLHVLTFAAAAFVSHTRLAAGQPVPSQQAEFSVWIALGGLSGGLFNGLLAPLLFDRAIEYPLMIVLACLTLPSAARSAFGRRERTLDLAIPLFIAATILLAIRFGPALGAVAPQVAIAALAVFAFGFRRQPFRFATCVGALLSAGLMLGVGAESVLHAERTFFGVYRVSEDRRGTYRVLAHGTTLRGMQALRGRDIGEPLAYYHRQGPFGQAFESLAQVRRPEEVGVIGLGVGALGAYAEPGQRWTFYEVDEAVERIARDRKYFTYLERCGPWCNVLIGDARQSLTRDPHSRYDLLVVDAFRADSIPAHLLTRESLDLYLKHLRPYGVMLFHMTNARLTLAPIVGRLADAHGLSAIVNVDRRTAGWPASRRESIWVALAKHLDDLGPIVTDPRWQPLEVPSSTPLWTDDFSNILSAVGRR